jgi:hypothetical protein
VNTSFSTELNENFTETLRASPPVGTIIAWLKNYTNTPTLPDKWVECNGQTLSDNESVYDGQVIPNLNGGSNRMLRGANTSGGLGGSDSHNHQFFQTYPSASGTGNGTIAWTATDSQGASVQAWDSNGSTSKSFGPDDDYVNVATTAWTKNENTIPAYYEVVWILKIK